MNFFTKKSLQGTKLKDFQFNIETKKDEINHLS